MDFMSSVKSDETLHALMPPIPSGLEPSPQALAAREVIAEARAEVLAKTDGGPDGPDQGNFPDNPTYRTVRGNPLVSILSDQCAITIGYPDVLNAVPTIQNMRRRQSEFGRYAETALIFRLVDSGPREESSRMLDRIWQRHTHVKGVLERSVGPHPKGTPYDAFDPERLIWTTASLGQAEQIVFEALYGRLPDKQREALWQGRLRAGALFGSPPDQAPATHQERDQYIRERHENGELYLTEAARFLGVRACFEATIPRRVVPIRRLLSPALLTVLPEETREIYDLPFGRREQARSRRALRILSSVSGAAAKLSPDMDARAFRMSAAEERRRKANGEPPPIPDPYV